MPFEMRVFHDLVEALQMNNANVGAGYIEKNGEQYLIRAPGQVSEIDDIEKIIVAHRDGVPVIIQQVAKSDLAKSCELGLRRLMVRKQCWVPRSCYWAAIAERCLRRFQPSWLKLIKHYRKA